LNLTRAAFGNPSDSVNPDLALGPQPPEQPGFDHHRMFKTIARQGRHVFVLLQRRARAHIPTQSLTPLDRQRNHDNQSKYEAKDSAEWLRQHGKGLFSFF
jgi:hypothetical protein